MLTSSKRDTRLIEAALADAVSAARWEWLDLATRRPDCAHDELILGRAAELALSPIARDQLLSIALERIAEEGPLDGSLIDDRRDCDGRATIAKRVFSLGPHKAADTDALVRTIEERHSRQLGADVRFDLLPQHLEQDAILHECLWDHPALPASDPVRLAMLCSVPKLQDRAQELTTPATGWRRWVRRWATKLARQNAI